jgi:Flp pilus assembly CpaF family ATPase
MLTQAMMTPAVIRLSPSLRPPDAAMLRRAVGASANAMIAGTTGQTKNEHTEVTNTAIAMPSVSRTG